MDAATLAALYGSIGKWEAIVEGSGKDFGSDNCPLCAMFMENEDACSGCPVSGKTKRRYCGGTPYDQWSAIGHQKAMTLETIKIAQAELDFLKSLLPKEEL